MLEFTINSKELNKLVTKANTAVDKKSPVIEFRSIFFQVDANGVLKLTSTNMDHWLEVRTDIIWSYVPGVFGIEADDMKLILKMSGEIHFKDISDADTNCISVKCGKREITVNKIFNTDIFMPDMDNTEAAVLETTKGWLSDTVTKLSIFVSHSETDKMMQCINFNTQSERVTALDGYRIGMHKIVGQKIHAVQNNVNLNAVLATPVLKAVLDRKLDGEVVLSVDKKWIKIAGVDFTYMIRNVDGIYFNVDQMLSDRDKYSFTAKTESLLESMKYNKDLVGKEKLPFTLHSQNGKLYSYVLVQKYEVLEELEVKELRMNDDLFIGFNPNFWVDALSVADADEVRIFGGTKIEPAMIYANEYSFLILPVRLNGTPDLINRMTKKFAKVA